LKRSLGILATAGLLWLTACGGYKSSSSNNTNANTSTVVAKVKHRVFVTNQFASFGTPSGQIDILDGDKDVIATSTPVLTTVGTFASNPITIALGGIPSYMVVTPDRKTTIAYDTNSATLEFVDNTTETLNSTLSLGDVSPSLVVASDNKTAFASARNTGQVDLLDITGPTLKTQIAVPTAHNLALSHNGKVLLVFSDDSNIVYSIDTTNIDTTTITSTTKPTQITSTTFDHPVYGIFSSDDSKAYILSCGAECGGTTASVSVLDIASGKVTGSTPVSGATIGILDSSGNLYVAGTQNNKNGKLDVVSTSGLTVSKSGIPISDGFHNLMLLASNNRLFVGARTCNNVTSGCLSMVNISAGSAVVDSPKGDVTGFDAVVGRNIVYVAEGGELRIYDTTKDAEVNSITSGTPIDIVGKAIDVKAIDQ
jgi:hypothetical protein